MRGQPENTMESRLTDLEIKVAFQEDLIETLNLAVARQQQQIDLLQAQFRALYQQVRASAPMAAESDPQHEIPPHY
ncbi:hypothetical protein Cmtc_38240 [Cupriavidus sp. TKC]|jgi:SlyX protein|nr:hypothetical protein Cmtc_38240 [Cupriavidus sp. TKC]